MPARTVVAVVLALVALVALGACGDEADDPPDGPAGGSVTTPTGAGGLLDADGPVEATALGAGLAAGHLLDRPEGPHEAVHHPHRVEAPAFGLGRGADDVVR